jgi:cardiolipin synthase
VPDVSYEDVIEPGRLDPTGPLAPSVQMRLREITGREMSVGNSVRLLVDGVQSYGAMLALVQAAEEEIRFENFILRADALGSGFAREMRRRAERGVHVRLLLDPIGTRLGLPFARRTFRHSRAEVRLYNPPRPTPGFIRFGRDHRKLLVQDGRRLVAGGMDLADIWVGNCVSQCTWRDSAVLAEGGVVSHVIEEFERMWQRGWRFAGKRQPGQSPVTTARPSVGAGTPVAGEVPIRVVADAPRAARVERLLIAVCEAAEREILVTNSYVVPPPAVIEALAAAAGRGVDVQLVLPHISDHPVVDRTAEHLVAPLLRAGIKVWRWTGPMIHAKTVVVDRLWSLAGSSNLDP